MDSPFRIWKQYTEKLSVAAVIAIAKNVSEKRQNL
jgi:hypothetical protein